LVEIRSRHEEEQTRAQQRWQQLFFPSFTYTALICSMADDPSGAPPFARSASAAYTASEPRLTLSAPARKYREATSRAEYAAPDAGSV